MNVLANHAVGHVRIFENGTKYYLARYNINNLTRWSVRKFRTADAAEKYAKRLVARYEALKKVKA
jgi:hypothetical protein